MTAFGFEEEDDDKMQLEYQEDLGLFDPAFERDMWLVNCKPQEMLEEFINVFHQKDKDPELGLDLIKEEYEETIEAYVDGEDHDLLKELADLVYVTYWFAEKKGWDLDEALIRVHESNMSKLGVDGKPIFRADGKVLKGPDYKEPDLKDLV